ncbi:MAG: hypothetical protein K2M31_07425 [Muribaculaceae bacterium]|nr:hypothetical protein [Muribaculaceae bacterium]
MTKDSTISFISNPSDKQMKAPRRSSIDFIRQFSRTYAVVAGIAINGVICN